MSENERRGGPRTRFDEERPFPPPPTAPPFVPSASVPESNALPYDFGVWGPPKVGKTVFLASALEFLRRVGTPYPAHKKRGGRRNYAVLSPSNGSDTAENNADFETQAMIKIRNGDFKLDANNPASPTDSMPFSRIIAYPDRGDGRDGRMHLIHMMDTAGENTLAPHDHRYWQNLKKCRGILMLFDGSGQADNKLDYSKRISHFMRAVPPGPAFQQNICICITKIDQNEILKKLSPTQITERFSNHHEREAFLQDIIGKGNLYDLLQLQKKPQGKMADEATTNFRIFMTSSVGWYQENQIWRSNLGSDGKAIRLNDWKPYNVVYALLWLLDRIEDSRLAAARRVVPYRITKSRRISNLTILREYLAETSGTHSMNFP